MECPKCGFKQFEEWVECPRCGVIFKKYRQLQEKTFTTEPFPDSPAGHSQRIVEIFKDVFLYVKPETHPIIFFGRMLFFLIFFIWGVKIIYSSIESIKAHDAFWHLVNLPFHEFGHILFRPLGRLMTSMGGSIAQILMPLVCLVSFLIKTRDTFSASFALWWTGQNFIDLAPYIDDARSLTLPLLGGNTGATSPYGFHDWEFILKETHLLPYDHFLARLFSVFGMGVIILACAWGGYVLFKQYRNLQMPVQQ